MGSDHQIDVSEWPCANDVAAHSSVVVLPRAVILLGIFLGLSVVAQVATKSEAATALVPRIPTLNKQWEAWNAPQRPFRIIGNIYYVGAAGISSFLVTTPQGHILIDTGFEATAPRILASLGELGFKTADIKIILNSHAHLDHAGGDARMKEMTGAKIMASEADAALLASGGIDDFTPFSPGDKQYPPVHADRLLRDGDTVELGGQC